MFLDIQIITHAGINAFYRSKHMVAWMKLSVRKCILWLTCLLGTNIDVLDRADSNDLQRRLSVKLYMPILCRNDLITLTCQNILRDWFAKAHHDVSTCTRTIVWLHTDSEVVHNDIDEKTDSSANQAKTQKAQTDSMVLGIHCNLNCCERLHRVSLRLHAVQIHWSKSK